MDKLCEEMARREQAQIELEQQSSFLRSFLDASPDLVFYRNIDKQFSGCNRAMELLTGKSEKQLIGLTPRDIYDEDAAGKVLETDEKVFRHITFRSPTDSGCNTLTGARPVLKSKRCPITLASANAAG
nr:Aerobic respiration control sensor protein ArcB [Candidatus Pantoea persica]